MNTSDQSQTNNGTRSLIKLTVLDHTEMLIKRALKSLFLYINLFFLNRIDWHLSFFLVK